MIEKVLIGRMVDERMKDVVYLELNSLEEHIR